MYVHELRLLIDRDRSCVSHYAPSSIQEQYVYILLPPSNTSPSSLPVSH